MGATWVLERGVFADGHAALAAAVHRAGGRVVDWRDDWWVDGRWPRLDGAGVVFHGSLANADRIRRELPWRPGAFCATDAFRCSLWWPRCRADLVTPEFGFSTVERLVVEGAPDIPGDRVFVRPDSPLKAFSGRVLPRAGLTLAALDHGFYYDDLDLPVVVAPAVEVGEEWRFVVAAGQVVAGSAYLADGRTGGLPVGPEHEAWARAAELAAGLQAPDPVFVLDVCATPAGAAAAGAQPVQRGRPVRLRPGRRRRRGARPALNQLSAEPVELISPGPNQPRCRRPLRSRLETRPVPRGALNPRPAAPGRTGHGVAAAGRPAPPARRPAPRRRLPPRAGSPRSPR